MPGPIRLRPRLRARWLAVAAIALVGLLYYKPLKTYLGRRAELAQRKAEVRLLRAQKTALQHRVDLAGGGEELLRQARLLGLVKPGEQLYIVKGIAAWRQAQSPARKHR